MTARALVLAAILLVGSPPAGAQIGPHQVEVFSNYFSPSRLSIRSGETVRWLARNGGHAVQADDGRFRLPESGTLPSGSTAEFTFTTDDEWVRFHCPVHPAMWGAIKIGDPPSLPGAEPPEVRTVPSEEFPTIASALDGIPEGATVELLPGSYDTSVMLDVDGVRLRGVGPTPGDVVVRGGGTRAVGVVGRATGLRVENLTLTGFTVAGIAMADADRFAVEHVAVEAGVASYGVRVQRSQYGRIQGVDVAGAGTAGVGVEDCVPCDLVVRNSTLRDGTVGLLADEVGSMLLLDSVIEDNVTGVVWRRQVAGTGAAGAHIWGNRIRKNTAPYAPRTAAPLALAPNVGVWIDGGRHVRIEDNEVEGHRYGIALTGAGAPTIGTSVHGNHLTTSSEADLAWDGLGARTCFANNLAQASEPPMIETLYDCDRVTVGVPLPQVAAKVMAVWP